MTTTTANLDLALIEEGQDLARVTHNEALNRLDGFVQLTVLDKDQTAPPGSPSDGDVYIVGASATGAWSGYDGYLAFYYSGWTFKAPTEGMRAWIADDNKLEVYDGSTWSEVGAGGSSHTFLSATHTDVVSATLQEGDIFVVVDQGSSTYKVQRIAHPGVACKWLHTQVPGVGTPGVLWDDIAASNISSGTFPVARGGTGLSTIAINSLLYASAADTISALGPGTEGHVLTISSGVPAWAAAGGGVSAIEDLSDVGAMTEAAGDLFTHDGSDWGNLAMGAANQFVTRNGGGTGLEWRVLAAADIPSLPTSQITSGAFAVVRGGTGLSTIAADSMFYATALDTIGTTSLSAFARTILDDADAAAVLSTIGAASSSHNHTGTYQPLDGDLTTLAGITGSAGGVLYYDGGWTQLAAGSDGDVLTLATGMPSWSAPGGGSPHTLESATHTDVTVTAGAAGDLLIRNAGDTAWVNLGVGASTTVFLGGTAPSYGQVTDSHIAAGAAISLSKLETLAADAVVVTDGSGNLTVSTGVTASELEFIGTVLSNVQDQIDSKADSGHNHDSAYISVVGTPDTGNFPTLTVGGELASSSYGPSSFATSAHDHAGTYEPVISALGVSKGGTGLGSIGQGAMLYADATDSIAELAAGTDGHVLTMSGGLPTWQAAGGGSDHGGLTGLGDDDHPQYAAIDGRAIGQTIIGGTGSGEDLFLASTSHGTKGAVAVVAGSSFHLPAFTSGSPPSTPPAGFGSIYCDDNGDLFFEDEGGTTTELTASGGGASTLEDLTDVATMAEARGDLFYRDATQWNRLAKGTENHVLMAGANDPTYGLIANANVDASAAIAYSKLNLTGAILDADLAGSISWSKVLKTGSNLTDLSTRAITDTTGTLTVARGGTGLTTLTGAGRMLYASGATTLATLAPGTAGQQLQMNTGATAPEWVDDYFCLAATLGNGTDAITASTMVGLPVPHKGTLTKVELISLDATSGSITIDIWNDSYANAPALDADSMVGAGTNPAINSGTKAQVTTFTSWTSTSVVAGSHVILNVDSASTVKLVGVFLYFKKTA